MAGNKTFTMIKPGAVNGQSGAIITLIEQAGFTITAMKLTSLSREKASAFYQEHSGKPFFEGLVTFMTSGKIIAMVLEKENAVEEFRKLIGATNPAAAAEGTIRKLFGKSVQENAIHGSDSDESAGRESAFFFSKMEQY